VRDRVEYSRIGRSKLTFKIHDSPDDYNKNDLVVALDKHLRNNQNIFQGLESLSGYYSRFSTPSRKGISPAKRDALRTPARRQPKQELKEEFR
jgi:hypothetical protein